MSDDAATEPLSLVVEAAEVGERLDFFLARRFPDYSRVHLRKVINAAEVHVAGKRTKASHRLREGDLVTLRLPDLPRPAPQPENIPLNVLYEDAELAVIDKRPGMVVHPGRGHYGGTLTAALQFHFNELSTAGGAARPGIVHRLDRDTSGVMVVARHDRAHLLLAEQFEQRSVEKEYFAIVVGRMDRDRDRIDAPIGFHPYQRERMAVRRDDPESRPAESFYEVVERFDGFATAIVTPKTGRTHQIRVHLASIGCPVLCDRLYGSRASITRGELRRQPDDATVLLERHALHARRLCFDHPATGERMEFTAPMPEDLERALEELRTWRAVEPRPAARPR